jgi:hypothetical protein
MDKLNIYDNYTIDLNKYPRKELNYRITDIVLITLFSHIQQIKKICNCYQEAYNSYNEVKDYYFTFHFPISNTLNRKTYSAKEIITIMKEINFNIQQYQYNTNQLEHYLKYKNNPLDVTLFFYLKNKEFFEKLINDLEQSKIFYFQGRNYSIKFDVPYDFYNYKQSNLYSALELIEIYSYSQYLVKNKIIKNLPLPKYLE